MTVPDRRAFLAATGALALLAACGGEEPPPPGPAVVTLAAQGGPGMNPSPDGSDRPVTLTVVRLKGTGAFNSADSFALQADPGTALGAEMVGMQQLVVPAGGNATATITMEPEATHLGVIALLRDPAGKVWRSAVPVALGTTPTATATLGPGGLALALS
jgi:type VI secretion system protein VasD